MSIQELFLRDPILAPLMLGAQGLAQQVNPALGAEPNVAPPGVTPGAAPTVPPDQYSAAGQKFLADTKAIGEKYKADTNAAYAEMGKSTAGPKPTKRMASFPTGNSIGAVIGGFLARAVGGNEAGAAVINSYVGQREKMAEQGSEKDLAEWDAKNRADEEANTSARLKLVRAETEKQIAEAAAKAEYGVTEAGLTRGEAVAKAKESRLDFLQHELTANPDMDLPSRQSYIAEMRRLAMELGKKEWAWDDNRVAENLAWARNTSIPAKVKAWNDAITKEFRTRGTWSDEDTAAAEKRLEAMLVSSYGADGAKDPSIRGQFYIPPTGRTLQAQAQASAQAYREWHKKYLQADLDSRKIDRVARLSIARQNLDLMRRRFEFTQDITERTLVLKEYQDAFDAIRGEEEALAPTANEQFNALLKADQDLASTSSTVEALLAKKAKGRLSQDEELALSKLTAEQAAKRANRDKIASGSYLSELGFVSKIDSAKAMGDYSALRARVASGQMTAADASAAMKRVYNVDVTFVSAKPVKSSAKPK